MRAVILIVPLLFLAACEDEPDFDVRYDKAAKEIEARAKAMDADIAGSEAAARTAADAADEPERAVEPGGKIPRARPEPLPDSARPSNAPSSSGE